MRSDPCLTIIGLGEDGIDGLSPTSRLALDQAEIVMGPTRHLALVPETKAQRIAWPVPFADGLSILDDFIGRNVVVLASGDPFWFGAGSVIAQRYAPNEWRAFPGSSTFSLVAARMGWPLEKALCFGLHAAPLTRLRPALAPDTRLIILLRDGAAVTQIAQYLSDQGFGPSTLTINESVGGPNERRTTCPAHTLPDIDFAHPVCVAVEVAGHGAVLPTTSGRPDDWFDCDGQITKRPVRALTLSALAPRPFEHLWDIGGGSGSISIEWLLSHPTLQATTIEPRADRAAQIRTNADTLGVDHLTVITGSAPDALQNLDPPDVVFIGGGLSQELLDHLRATLPKGTRIVANAVTLESEALLTQAQSQLGGKLMRIELAHAETLGPRLGWKSRYPVVQWSTTL